MTDTERALVCAWAGMVATAVQAAEKVDDITRTSLLSSVFSSAKIVRDALVPEKD